MNILPKKKWHVRTKANIERVRRDEAKAADEEREKQRRALLAEQESRTALLRERSKHRLSEIESQLQLTPKERPLAIQSTSNNLPPQSSHEETFTNVVFVNGSVVAVSNTITKNSVQFSKTGHVNLFADLEEGKKVEGVANKEHDDEKRREQEDYEKKIGYLTYLGQGSSEATKETAWYEKPSMIKRLKTDNDLDTTKAEKDKSFHDPLVLMKKYCGEEPKGSKTQVTAKPGKALEVDLKRKHKPKKKRSGKEKKRKKRSRSSSSSSDSDESTKERHKTVERLRQERLKREQAERAKAENLLAKLQGKELPAEKPAPAGTPVTQVKPKYHSQYNPTATRQNLDSKTKYWLE